MGRFALPGREERSMPFVSGMRCVCCQREYPPDAHAYTCPTCGEDDGLLDIVLDAAAARRSVTRERIAANPDRSVRRWLPLLPVTGVMADGLPSMPRLDIGGTPLYCAPSLSRQAGVAEVTVKDDGRNPTASYKDRASAVVIARAREQGIGLITVASTGNAASSLAGQCAAEGVATVIFVPRTAPPAKLTQLLIYGAHVVAVDGTYDDAFELSRTATRLFGWYNRNTGYNPYTIEGKKTAAFELAEQLGYNVPDMVFVPTGDGCIVSGIHKGFTDLRDMGFIDRLPRMIVVQAEGSRAIHNAFHGGVAEVENATTVADSISVNRPRVALHALRALRESGGDTVLVSDDEILAAMPVMARETGVFAEPAAAAALAGLLAMGRDGRLRGDERVSLMITGNGLKDVGAAMRAAGREPVPMAPGDEGALRAFGEALEARAGEGS